MTNDWQAWKDRMWANMEARFGYPGYAPLEQYMIRSRREQRCIECGEPGTVRQESRIVPSVSHYWMCGDCEAYWQAKGAA